MDKTLSYDNIANLLLAMGNNHAYQNWLLKLKLSNEEAISMMEEAIA